MQRFFADLEPFPHASTQAERRLQTFRMACHFARQAYDKEGRWLLSGRVDLRDRLWNCFGLLEGEPKDRALAEAILMRAELETHIAPRSPEEAASTDFDIFSSNHVIQMLVLHGKKLPPALRKKLEDWGRLALRDYAGDRQCDYQFQGYNDNMPAKATLGCVLGGEYFGDDDAVNHGLWNLRQLRDMFTRRGLISEYTSPTYLPLTLTNLNEVATLARNTEARELASQCVERLWADFLGHFHPPTGILPGGPSSRSYTADSLAHNSQAHILLWLALGDDFLILNPLEELRHEPPRIVLHAGGRLCYNATIPAWIASCEYHVPPHLLEWMKSRSYPFRLIATAERGEMGTGDTGEVLTTAYQEEDFTLGTVEGESNNQCEPLYISYRRLAPATDIEHVRTVYTRFLIDDQRPGELEGGGAGDWSAESGYLFNYGRTHTVQLDRVAMALSRPWVTAEDKPVTSLRFCVIVPEHFGPVENLELLDGHVFLRDGPIHVAFRPLNSTDWGRKDSVRIENANRYRVVSFFNYEGPPRVFTRKELSQTLSGVVAVVGLKREESFEEFRRRVLCAQLVDYYCFHARTVRYRLGDTEFGFSYATEHDRVRHATINGKIVPRPLWQADGLPAEHLPFLNGPPQPNKLEIPYKHLRVVWDPKRWWVIGSRG